MKKIFLILSLFCATVTGQDGNVTVEAEREILRRGNYIQIVDGFQQQDTPIDAMAPPADDSHKWFITVISQANCSACNRLKYDFANSKELHAWVDVNDYKKSFTHYHVYDYNDATQNWRFKNIKIKAFPTIVIQPPLNKKYGDPSTVVDQITGYDGNAKKLSERIRSSMIRYVNTLSKNALSAIPIVAANTGFAQATDGLGQRRPTPDFLPPDLVPDNVPDFDKIPQLPSLPSLPDNDIIGGFQQIFNGFLSVFTGTTGSNIVQGLLLFVIVILLTLMFMKSVKSEKKEEKKEDKPQS